MTRRRAIAAAGTALAAILIAVVLLLVHLRFDRTLLPDPPRPTAGLLEEEEEYAELYTPPQSVKPSDPRPAQAPEPKPADPPKVVAPKPSPTPAAPPPPVKPAPTQQEIEMQEMKEDMASAFSTPAPVNGSSEGKGGVPEGKPSNVNGQGMGSVGGGWIMPHYDAVRCEQTGSVILRVIIDRDGKVVKVEQIGGQAPASANAAVVAECIAEVKSRTFTRKDDNAPGRAIATVTYRWR